MFTGIIEEVGALEELRRSGEGAVAAVAAPRIASALRPGDSVAVNGVCVTATRLEGTRFRCDLSPETLRRTSFAGLGAGAPVNLERPLAIGDRLGGHFVLGHVDGIGQVLGVLPSGDGSAMRFRYPADLARYLVWKGSVAVDGISLTIAELEEDSFTVAVIPHTLRATNLGTRRPGDSVNLEVDVLGKYFERYAALGLARPSPPGLTAEYLEEQGF